MAQLRGQPPKGNQPPKDDKPTLPVAKPKGLMDGIVNQEPLAGVQRFLLQEGLFMKYNKKEYKYADTETPPSKWFGEITNELRGLLIKKAEKEGATGSDKEKIEEAMKTPAPLGNTGTKADVIKLFESNKLKPEWDYKPVKIDSLRANGGSLKLTQFEVIDLSKLLRMDLRTNGAQLQDAPSRVEVGYRVNKFLDDVLFESQKKGSPDIAVIYERKKTTLLKSLEEKQKKFSSELKQDEMIDFDAYKSERKDREGKPINDRDGKPIKEYDPKKIIQMTMIDNGINGLSGDALAQAASEGQNVDKMNQGMKIAAIPPASTSDMLKDKLKSMPKDPTQLG